MLKPFKFEKYFTYLALIIFSYTVNYYVASRGVFPVDTFIHYDNGFKILLGELPVRDYWIVHGFLIDYMQSVFFYLFGANWNSYIIHSSIFNVIISIFTYLILTSLEIKNIYSIVISSSVFPMPEKTIFLALIPAFVAFSNSPIDTTSAPEPIFFNSLSKVRFEFDFTEKHIVGLITLNALLKI